MDKIVYWRYGDKSDYWHLYPDCKELHGAVLDGTLCKGKTEVAINTGREKVCPVCKARSDREYWEEQAQKEITQKTENPPEPKVKPAAQKVTRKKPVPTITGGQAWAIAIAVALCTWLACLLYYSDVCTNIEDSAYSQGYDIGYDEASNLFDTYYKRGYTTGRADGMAARQNSYAVYITKNGSKYHADGCSYLRGSRIAVDVKEAIKGGYTACSRCNS